MCLKIHGTHMIANNSTNNNVFFFVSDLKIVNYNNYKSLITILWTREEKIFCVTTYLETKSFKTVQAKFSRKSNFTIIKKPKLSLSTQISSHRVSKQPQLEGRKFQIWQEVNRKMSWQYGCSERFCWKEPEKVSLKMFPKTWFLHASLQRILKKDLQLYPYRIQIKHKLTPANNEFLVSVIYHCHINGLHQFWDTLY